MEKQLIDVTGLSTKQIAMLQEIVTAFRAVSQQESSQEEANHSVSEEDELQQLHKEFDWWVADVGVKAPLNRNSIYDID